MSKCRCRWVNISSELYVQYHDIEWGVPVLDDATLYEMLFLECFQAGLSWFIILKKRENFRAAFDGFDAEKIAAYDEGKIQELLQNEGIIRSRGKIAAAITNTQIYLNIQKEFGTFSNYLWGFSNNQVVTNIDDIFHTQTELSDRVAADLKKRGMKYAGSVTIYSYLQAIGIVNDHELACYRHTEV